MPWRSFTVVALLTVTTMGCSNSALMYLNYPTQVRSGDGGVDGCKGGGDCCEIE